MSTALALIDNSQYDLMAKLAKVAALSTYTKQSEVQSMFIMLKGYELGISPMQALDGIQVIQGKTTVSPQLMLAMINRSGQLEDMKIDSDAKICTVMMKRVGRSPHTETFSIENAKAMGLADKDNYRKQPAVMLKWRAVSACARVVFPDVIQGMYTPEEMGAEVSEDASGELVIETPILDANFKKAESDVARLAAGVDSDGVIEGEMVSESRQDAPSSDLQQQTASVVVDTPTAAETAKAKLGTPSKQTVAPKAAQTTNYNIGDLKTRALKEIYENNVFHMNKSLDKLNAAGLLPTTLTLEQALEVIRTRKEVDVPA
jgi:hypothetical protein